MKPTPLLAIGIIVLLLVIAGAVYFFAVPKASAPTTTATSTLAITTAAQNQNTATYLCDTGTINATYTNSTLPTSSVTLVLSDGRTFTLPQVMSGSGIRYEQGAGTASDIQFSSEGENAFLTENGKITYNNCVAGAVTSDTNGMKTFVDQANTFTFSYPSSFTISGDGVGYSTDWMVNSTTSGMILAKATLPSSFEPKTNFAGANFTVGTSADPTAIAECLSPTIAEDPGASESTVTINGVTYNKFVTNDAGAGNFT